MSNFLKYMRLFALGITFSSSMALPYVQIKFYDVFREATQASNNELGLLMTIFTAVSMALYIPGGVLADRGSPKKLLLLSLIMMCGLNAYFAYTVVLSMGYSWQMALMAVFVEGIIFIVLSLTNVREGIFNAIPMTLKRAVSVGIGLFVAFVGLQNAKLIVNSDSTLVTYQHFKGETFSSVGVGAILALLGVVITAILLVKHVKGGILYGILITWVLGIVCELTGIYIPNPDAGMYSVIPTSFVSFDFSALGKTFGQVFKTDFSGVGILNFFAVMFSFLFVDLFDTLGTLIGVASKADMLDEEGKLPHIKGALMADSIATCAGAVLGTSTTTTFVESASGVTEGGRTGLTSMTTGVLFLLAGAGWNKAVAAMVAVLCMGAPLSSTLIAGIASLRLQRAAAAVGAVVPGWQAIEQLGGIDTLQIDADDLFTTDSAQLEDIRIFKGGRIDRAILYSASVLSQCCNTLSGLFRQIIEDRTDILYPVKDLEVHRGLGFSAWCDNNRVLIGSRAYMEKEDVPLPDEEYEAKHSKNGELQILYLAVSGSLHAMFVLRYVGGRNAARGLEQLQKENIQLLVSCQDPSLTARQITDAYHLPEGMVVLLDQEQCAALDAATAQNTGSEDCCILCTKGFASLTGGLQAADQAQNAENSATTVQMVSVLFSIVIAALLTSAHPDGLAVLGVADGIRLGVFQGDEG